MAGLLEGSMIRIQLMSTLWAIFMSRKSGTTASRNLFPAKMPTSRVSSDRSSSLKVGLIRMTGLARWRRPAYRRGPAWEDHGKNQGAGEAHERAKRGSQRAQNLSRI